MQLGVFALVAVLLAGDMRDSESWNVSRLHSSSPDPFPSAGRGGFKGFHITRGFGCLGFAAGGGRGSRKVMTS